MNKQRGTKIVDRFDKLLAAALLVVAREQTPFGARMIKSEVNELARKFCLLFFDFRVSRGESKGTACGAVRLVSLLILITSVSDKVTDGLTQRCKVILPSLRAECNPQRRARKEARGILGRKSSASGKKGNQEGGKRGEIAPVISETTAAGRRGGRVRFHRRSGVSFLVAAAGRGQGSMGRRGD